MIDPNTATVRILLAAAKRNDFVASEPSLAEALATVRTFWNEEAGPQTFLFIDQSGRVLATMTRLDRDSEIALTMHSDGTIEAHRCHYRIVAGVWKATEVTPMSLGELTASQAAQVAPWTTEDIINHAG